MNTLALTAETSKMGIGDAGIAAVLGYGVVFLGLVLLMCVVIIMGKAMASTRNKAKAEASGTASPAAAAPAPTAPSAPPAPGSAGEVKLFDVPDKEAAMLMAIVADKMGKPLNELRFKSIKEVK